MEQTEEMEFDGMTSDTVEEAGATFEAVAPSGPPERSRKVRRYRRRSHLRAKTIALKRLTKEEIRLGQEVYPPVDVAKPRMRRDCEDGPRPCPFVSCKHHLYLDVNPDTGSIKLNFPHLEPWEMSETCALDVAERGGITLEEVGAIVNLTRERVRQVEVHATEKLRAISQDDENTPPQA